MLFIYFLHYFQESLVATDAEEAEKKVLDLCYQTDPITFAECISDRFVTKSILSNLLVYMKRNKKVLGRRVNCTMKITFSVMLDL